MKRAFSDLIEFESACGHSLSEVSPEIPNLKTLQLRERLISEEYEELMTALNEEDMEGIVDGACDLIYVILGTCVRFGIDPVPVWEAIHAANLKKFGEGSWRDENNKIMKPPNWKHPDIQEILDGQKPLAELYPKTGRPAEGEAA
jgi:predicted HAD superfamily Cof-like phosphohydrolase